jgi:hypothetical protein
LDFSITALSVSQQSSGWYEVKFTARVFGTNCDGQSPTVALYIEGDRDQDMILPNFCPTKKIQWSFTVSELAFFSGDNEVKVVIDDYEEYSEPNENNNQMSTTVSIPEEE